MLSEIIKAFEQTGEPMDLNALSHRLDTERSALEGMLRLLVRQGKLREIKPGSDVCTQCGHRVGCHYLKSGQLGTVYELPQAKTNKKSC